MALAIGSKRDGLGKTALAYLPSAVVPALAALVGTALFARGFGPAAFGRYALACGVAVLGAAAGAQWLQQAANRFLPATDDQESRAAFELGYDLLTLACLLGGLALAALAYPLVGPTWRPLLFPTALLTAATAAYNARLSPFQARADARNFGRYRVLGALLQTVLGLLALHMGVAFALAAQAAGLAVLLPSMKASSGDGSPCSRGDKRANARNQTRERKGEPWGRGLLRLPKATPNEVETLKAFWRYGAPLGAWAVASSLLALGERYVLVAARGEAEGGLYAANAAPVVMGVTLAAMPFLAAVHPRLMRAWDAGDRKRAANGLAAATEAFVFAGLALACLTIVATPALAVLLGGRFKIEAGTMGAVALGAALGQASMLLHKPLEFAERTGAMLLFALLAAAAKLIAMALLAPRFGYAAAPWTTVGAYGLYGALCLFAVRDAPKPGAGAAMGVLATIALCVFPSMIALPLGCVFAALSLRSLRRGALWGL